MSNPNFSALFARAQARARTRKNATLADVLGAAVVLLVEDHRQQRITQARAAHPDITQHLTDEDVLRWLKLGG